MEEGQRAWWCAHVVQLIFSVAATAASGAYVAAHPNAFSAAYPPPSVALPSAIVCATAGFCAFQLWLLIMTHRRSYLRMAHLSVVLMIFAAAAHKGDHTALLTALLLSEGHTVCTVAGRLQVPPPSPPAYTPTTHKPTSSRMPPVGQMQTPPARCHAHPCTFPCRAGSPSYRQVWQRLGLPVTHCIDGKASHGCISAAVRLPLQSCSTEAALPLPMFVSRFACHGVRALPAATA